MSETTAKLPRLYHALAEIDVPAAGDDYSTDSFAALPTSRLVRRGDEILIDDAFIAATTDRRGHSWATEMDADDQVQRWGRQIFAEGPVPESIVEELELEQAQQKRELFYSRNRALAEHGLLRQGGESSRDWVMGAQVSRPARDR